MKTKSDPREWYRQEELARERLRNHKRRRSKSTRLTPIYVLTGLIAVGAIYLTLVAAGVVQHR